MQVLEGLLACMPLHRRSLLFVSLPESQLTLAPGYVSLHWARLHHLYQSTMVTE